MRTCLSALVVCLIAGWAGAAFAQEDERQRGRPIPRVAPTEFEPKGFRSGQMMVFPRLGIAGSFNDNIFLTDTGEEEDFIAVISPALELRSDWEVHALELNVGADIGRNADFSSEDYEDARAGLDGRLDLSRTDYLFIGAGFRRGHEDRGDPDDIAAGREPGIFHVISANLGAYGEMTNRFHIRVEATFDDLNYDDVDTSLPPLFIANNDDRDRQVFEAKLRPGYNLDPGTQWEVFVQGAISDRDYDSLTDLNQLPPPPVPPPPVPLGLDRDSTGYEAVAGLALDLTKFGFTLAEVYAGYLARDYDDGRLETVDGPSFGATVAYAASPVTTLQASVSRFIQETTLAGTSGIMQTVVGGSLDHLFRRNLALNVRAVFTNNDYEGITRDDDIFGAGAGLTYFLTRNFNVEARYRFRSRDSDALPSADYSRNQVLIAVTAQW